MLKFAMLYESQESNLGSKRWILGREVGPIAILVTHTVFCRFLHFFKLCKSSFFWTLAIPGAGWIVESKFSIRFGNLKRIGFKSPTLQQPTPHFDKFPTDARRPRPTTKVPITNIGYLGLEFPPQASCFLILRLLSSLHFPNIGLLVTVFSFIIYISHFFNLLQVKYISLNWSLFSFEYFCNF